MTKSKRRLLIAWLMSLFFGLSATPLVAAERSVQFQGEARSPDGRLLYQEQHHWVYRDQRLIKAETDYLGPDARPIARMESDYSQHPYLPDYRFEDFRFQREDGARIEGDTVTVFGRPEAGAALQQTRLSLHDNMIGGQGLHFFIRDHLDTLLAGEVLTVRFVIPLQQDYYTFRIERLDNQHDGTATASFKISIDNWLVRLFAPEMQVRYAIETGRLLHYRGPSNLLADDRDMQNVVIDYRYPDSDLASIQ